jgi:hypothetical protein
MYEVEKGIKMPEENPKYPFRLMEIGDSFEFPSEELPKVRWACNAFRRKSQPCMKFVFKVNRCWRVK